MEDLLGDCLWNRGRKQEEVGWACSLNLCLTLVKGEWEGRRTGREEPQTTAQVYEHFGQADEESSSWSHPWGVPCPVGAGWHCTVLFSIIGWSSLGEVETSAGMWCSQTGGSWGCQSTVFPQRGKSERSIFMATILWIPDWPSLAMSWIEKCMQIKYWGNTEWGKGRNQISPRRESGLFRTYEADVWTSCLRDRHPRQGRALTRWL